MKKALLSVIIVLFSAGLFAQNFKIDTILLNGSTDNRINLVFMGDGYSASEQIKFLENANKLTQELFAQTPFKEYKRYFNVFAIEIISNESGAKHPGTAADEPSPGEHPISNPDNYFGSTFDNNSTHRALVLGNPSLALNILANHIPEYDQGFMLVNTPYYGGTGGIIATSSINASSGEIVIHEMGHSFGGLSDEYWAGAIFARETPNMTAESSVDLVKWKRWVGFKGVNVFKHNGSSSWYKPTTNICKMELLGVSFCPVCAEQIVTVVQNLIPPILNYTPMEATLTVSDSIKFSVSLINPIPNTFKRDWILNGKSVKKNIDSLTVYKSELANGKNTFMVNILDTTKLIRSNLHKTAHFYTIEWSIQNSTNGIQTQNKLANEVSMSVFPNPSSDLVSIAISDNMFMNGVITISDISGKIIASNVLIKSNEPLILNTTAWPSGNYAVIYTNTQTQYSQILTVIR